MFDCHSKLNQFYNEKVRLRNKHDTLRKYRDANVERVKDGTKKLREKENIHHPLFCDDFSQGSMAMHTINEAQNDDDQDIDHALIYEEADALADPKDMRDFVARAVNESGGNFKTEPEAQTNAVTIWYQDNYHVDLAIYKRKETLFGGYTYYHAGESWTQRDPKAINDWFQREKDRLGPQKGLFSDVTVESDQVRRIVRLLKFWSKSRSSWSLPSGLVLTALVVEKYVPDNKRDDVALIKTLKAIRTRLVYDKDVRNPTDGSLSLVPSDKHKKQLDSLFEKLDSYLIELEQALDRQGCTEQQALKAWSKFYSNDWWSPGLNKSGNALDSRAQPNLEVEVTISKGKFGRRMRYSPWSNQTIPKQHHIRLVLKKTAPYPDKIEWTVENSGDEAKWENSLEPRKGHYDENDPWVCNETSAYRGNHKVICKVTRGTSTNWLEIPIRIRR